MHETLVSGCVQGRLKPIIGLRQGQLAGYQPSDEDVPPAGFEGNPLLPAIPGRVAARLRHLRRMRGVEEAAAMPGEFFIFVHFQSAEVACGRLVELAGMLCGLLPDPNRLVIAVPFAAAKSIAQTLCARRPAPRNGDVPSRCPILAAGTPARPSWRRSVPTSSELRPRWSAAFRAMR